jgi:hypothetical protein
MPRGNIEREEIKLLPDESAAEVSAPRAATAQLADMTRRQLEIVADEIGVDHTRFKSRQELVAAVHAHRQMIALLDRDALVDVMLWAHRPIASNATTEQLAREVARLRTMRFAGLSQRGLMALAKVRGVEVDGSEPVPILIRKLKRKEGIFARLNRKRRAMLGAIVANMIGEESAPSAAAAGTATKATTIKEEIEEAGLIGGLTGRIKKSADSYLNQKLDEIEERIDRKLDEIDRRLAEWRDKEIANRIRILKITLWASVVVSALSLLYLYVKVYMTR